MSKMNLTTDVDCNKKRKIKEEPEFLDNFCFESYVQPVKKIKVEVDNDVSCDDKDQIQFEKEDLLNLVEKDFGKEVCETVLL